MRRRFALGIVLLLGTTYAFCQTHPAKSKKVYLERLQAQVDDAATKLRELERNGATLGAGQKAKFQLTLRGLWQKERIARLQLQQMKSARESRWAELRKREDATIISLNKSYRYVVNHYLSKK